MGIAEAKKHWFVDQHGPWSKALEKEAAAAQPDPGKPQ
jgi:hypothetical protein